MRSFILDFIILFAEFSERENICSGEYCTDLMPWHLTPTVYTRRVASLMDILGLEPDFRLTFFRNLFLIVFSSAMMLESEDEDDDVEDSASSSALALASF